ncbi:hypothetical protein KA047_02045 [Candidatus Saccharibacteria bacterium]|nr:hypothetical protein [Candidatus Saccharibacteria bacterium]
MSELIRKVAESKPARAVASGLLGAAVLAGCGNTIEAEPYVAEMRIEVGCPNGDKLVTNVEDPFVTVACVDSDGISKPVEYADIQNHPDDDNKSRTIDDYEWIDAQLDKLPSDQGLDKYFVDISAPGTWPSTPDLLSNPNNSYERGYHPILGRISCNYDVEHNGNLEGFGNHDNYDCTPYSEWTDIHMLAVDSKTQYCKEDYCTVDERDYAHMDEVVVTVSPVK